MLSSVGLCLLQFVYNNNLIQKRMTTNPVFCFIHASIFFLIFGHVCSSVSRTNLLISNKKDKVYYHPESIKPDVFYTLRKTPYVCTDEETEICYSDQMGFDAISILHSQIDDDQNGNVDRSESHDFLREDIRRDIYSSESHYHENDDLVTVQDLWDFWIHSEVHNWTVEDVVKWLDHHVELGQYAEQFRVNEVDGKLLPRLACSIRNPLHSVIGIRNSKHRQKISLKATDIVLFGVPKSQQSIFPDTIFVFSILLALGGCGLGYRQHKLAKIRMQNLANDLKTLQKAEDALKKFQTQLEEFHRKQREEEDKRDELKRMLQTTAGEEEYSDHRIRAVHDELVQNRVRLVEVERQLAEHKRNAIPDLQQWLQLTYEIELTFFEERRNEAIKRLQDAKQMCESMRRQKFKLFRSFRSSTKPANFQTSDVEHSLEEIKTELEERSVRWKEIERITSFNIMTNPGIPYLNTLLRGSASSLLSVPSILSSATLNKISTIPGHLNTYPIMSNLLKAGMQLSAVGVNNPMLRRQDDTKQKTFNDASHISLPVNKSQVSLDSSNTNLSSMKLLGHNCSSLKSFTPSHPAGHLHGSPHNSLQSLDVSSTLSINTLKEHDFGSKLNKNNNNKNNNNKNNNKDNNENTYLKPANDCNGHTAVKKDIQKLRASKVNATGI